jgi:hypothetical protein
MMKRFMLIPLLVVLAVVLACAPSTAGRSDTAASLQDIGGIQQLQTRFAQDTGKPRLILLVSPT